MDKAAEFDGEVTNIACGEEVGLVGRRVDNVACVAYRQVATEGADVGIAGAGIFGKLGSVCEPDCCA